MFRFWRLGYPGVSYQAEAEVRSLPTHQNPQSTPQSPPTKNLNSLAPPKGSFLPAFFPAFSTQHQTHYIQAEPGKSSHIKEVGVALDFKRMAAMSMVQLTTPYSWSLKQLLKFLAPSADTLENTSDHPPPRTILTRTSSRTSILDTML